MSCPYSRYASKNLSNSSGLSPLSCPLTSSLAFRLIEGVQTGNIEPGA
jgi:hypothetical protein